MISQLRLLKVLVVFSLITYTLILISASKTENKLKTLKKQKSVPCTKKILGKKKVITDLLPFFQMFQKFTKGVCMIRSMICLKINFLDTNTSFHGRKDATSPDKKEVCRAILTDLSKALDCTSS